MTDLSAIDFAVIVPMANEQETFAAFTDRLAAVLDRAGAGTVYIIVDEVSADDTLALARELSAADTRFVTVWAPENRNVVDAYIRGMRAAFEGGHEVVVEMDAGLSHDPDMIPDYLEQYVSGCECVFGSRYMSGGANVNPPLRRAFFSKSGTLLANALLGTRLTDMTSGYELFARGIVGAILDYELKSKAHFYQTEIRYLLRNTRFSELPIVYRSPSNSASWKAVRNSIWCLLYYFGLRLTGRAPSLSA